jgi:hypothetical protein
MTPQLAPQPCTLVGDTHLTEEQFGDLLVRPAGIRTSETSLAEAHVLNCEQCAAELATLRQSLSLFLQASNTFADNELRNMPAMQLPSRPAHTLTLQPTYWVAAAALVLAAFLPMQMMHRHSLQSAPTTAVTIADRPVLTDDVASVDIDSSASTSTQRKD